MANANLVLVHPLTAVLLTPVSRSAVSATVIASVAVPILVQGQGTAVCTQLANGFNKPRKMSLGATWLPHLAFNKMRMRASNFG